MGERETERDFVSTLFSGMAMFYSQEIDYHAAFPEITVCNHVCIMHACIMYMYIQTGRKHAAFPETVHDHI